MRLPAKTFDCLMLAFKASQRSTGDCSKFLAWSQCYDNLCSKYSEKAVIRKMERFADRGYIEYGVSPRTGWITPKGAQLLLTAMEFYA